MVKLGNRISKEQAEKERELMISMLKQGSYLNEIADALGCSKSGVKYKINNYGIDSRSYRRSAMLLSESEIRDIDCLFNQGYNIKEVSERLGIGIVIIDIVRVIVIVVNAMRIHLPPL